MPFCCLSIASEIEVVIANGSTENVICRLTSDRVLIKNKTGGGGVNVAGVAGIEGNLGVEYEHRVGGGDGYSRVTPGSSMPYETTGKPAYLTIISETGIQVCLNFEVNRKRSFIVSKSFSLKFSSKQNQWTDIDGYFYGVKDQSEDVDSIQANEAHRKIYESHFNRDVDAGELINGMDRQSVPDQNVHNDIVVANGSNDIIYCRFEYTKFDTNQIDDTKQYKLRHTPIAPNSHLMFITTHQYHDMTITSRSNVHICMNHVVRSGNSYIVSEGNFLKDSIDGEKWKDTDGIDHKKAAPNTIIKNDEESLNPLNLFPDNKTSDLETKIGIVTKEACILKKTAITMSQPLFSNF